MKLSIETAKVYCLRKLRDVFGWADITIRSWKNGGSIDVQSDYGSYAYNWCSTGTDDIREFLVRLDYSYFMGKAHHGYGYETDWEGTVAEIKRLILESRRDGSLKADDARECFDDVERLDHGEGFFWEAREYQKLYDFISDHDYPKRNRRNPQCNGFWTIVWPEICKVWREEIAAEAQQKAAPPAPRETILTPEQNKKRYWAARCAECGWIGPSCDLGGGQPIPEAGDYDDVTCPKCNSTEVDEISDIKPRPLAVIQAAQAAHVEAMEREISSKEQP